MLAQTMVIADPCQFDMDELRYEYPEDLVPPHLTPGAYLRQLTYDGATNAWPAGIPDNTVALIEKELDLTFSCVTSIISSPYKILCSLLRPTILCRLGFSGC